MSRRDVEIGKGEVVNYLHDNNDEGTNYEELQRKLGLNEWRKPGFNMLYFEGNVREEIVDNELRLFLDPEAEEPDSWKTVTESMEFEYDWLENNGGRNPALLRPVMKEHYSDFDRVEEIKDSFEEDEFIGLYAENESVSGHQNQIHCVFNDRAGEYDTVKVFQEWKVPVWAKNARDFVFRKDSDRRNYVKAIVNYNEETESPQRFDAKKEESHILQGLNPEY